MHSIANLERLIKPLPIHSFVTIGKYIGEQAEVINSPHYLGISNETVIEPGEYIIGFVTPDATPFSKMFGIDFGSGTGMKKGITQMKFRPDYLGNNIAQVDAQNQKYAQGLADNIGRKIVTQSEQIAVPLRQQREYLQQIQMAVKKPLPVSTAHWKTIPDTIVDELYQISLKNQYFENAAIIRDIKELRIQMGIQIPKVGTELIPYQK